MRVGRIILPENPEIGPQKHTQIIFDKNTKPIYLRIDFSRNGAVTTGHP